MHRKEDLKELFHTVSQTTDSYYSRIKSREKVPHGQKKDTVCVGVGGIKEDAELQISSFGYIRNIQKKKDQYAFIEFESEDEAASALDNMDGAVIEGRLVLLVFQQAPISPTATIFGNREGQ